MSEKIVEIVNFTSKRTLEEISSELQEWLTLFFLVFFKLVDRLRRVFSMGF